MKVMQSHTRQTHQHHQHHADAAQAWASNVHWLASSPRATRRGSALLIVIGTLALISVFAAIYISIGQTDRRAANAVRARIDLKDTSKRFGEDLSSVIGIDRLAGVIEHANPGSGNAFGRREATDAPYTDWTRRTEGDPSRGFDLFLPSGQPYAIDGVNANADFRVASDPWLASTTPVYLGNPGFQNMTRPFSRYDGYDPLYPNAKNFMDNRDWLQISNFAPDGRFVNLFNLRPNSVSGYGSSVDGEIGRFDAQPGIGISEDPNDNNRRIRRMSNYLSLLKMQNENDFESLIQAFDPSVEGVWVPGQNVPLPGVISSGDVFNTPAVWTMYQRFMFMPINQPFITLNRNNQVSTWADPDYPAYQYADANGDGMADSRWFEFTAARDINAGTSDRLRDDVEVLYDRKSYRYFVAARAMDLSALVNVNTATDLLVPPTKDYPLGLTPADVDLRRLLTMQDPASDYTTNGNNLPLSYGQLRRPYRGDDEPAFGPWNPANGNGWVQRNIARNVNDYWAYKQEFDRSIGLHGDLRTLDPDSNAMLIGRYAYDALRRGITLGSSLTTDYRGFDPAYTRPPLQVPSTELVQYERDPTDVSAVPGQITQRQRADQYINVGSLDPTNQGLAWARNLDFKTRASDVTIDYYGSGLYGMEDLSELLTFHGLNDPEVTTRLERVTTGRYESPSVSSGNDILQTRRFGPLMSNRDLSLDRDQHGYTMIDIFRDPSIAPSSADRTLREVNGRVAFNTMAQQALTPRNKITTISGSVPLLGTDLVFDPSVSTALTAQSAAPEFKTVLSNPSLLFGVYSKALAGAIDTPTGPNTNFFTSGSNWEPDATNFPNSMVSTLFYGHRGPELALRVAAHAAVNMKDLSDSDTNPTVATLIVNNSEGAALRTALMSNLNPSDATYQLYPGLASGNLFDVGAGVLPSSPLPLKRQVVNVYGFEAMPVITEVSVLYAYTDASVQAGGDEDYDPDSQPLLIPGGGESHPEPIQKISIDGTVGPGNSDYLIEVLAFQLHNPYDQPISLGGRKGFPNDAPLTRQRDANNENIIDTSSNYGFEYYIEYAGRFYKVAKYIEWYPTENHPEGASYRNLDNPANTQAYGTVNNPTDISVPNNGFAMDPGSGATEAFYSDFITRNVVLGPRETRVFYVIADKRFDGVTGPDAKWTQNLIAWGDLPFGFSNPAPANDLDMDLLPDGANGDTRGWTGPAEQWVEHQFRVLGSGLGGGGVDPVMMMEFDPRDGKLRDESVFADPTVVPTSPLLTDVSRQDVNEVRLWKKIVVSGEETTESTVTGITSPTMRNLMENDLLVDRMELGISLRIPLDPTIDLDNTVSYKEDYPLPGSAAEARGVRNDNTGITVARWATVRRVDSQDLEQPARGQITPWMLRSRSTPGLTQTSHASTLPNVLDGTLIFEGGADDPDATVTIMGDFEIQKTHRAFFNLSSINGANAIIQTIALAPHLKSNVLAGAVADIGDGANNSAGKFQANVLSLAMTAMDTTNKASPEIFVGGSNVGDTPRLADLLLAWGIGPAYAPDPNRAPDSKEYLKTEWMTGPEAMAIAMGIDNPTSPPAGDEPDVVWKNPYDITSKDFLLDDGHLVIDNFVSYLNVVTETPPKFTPGAGGDIPRGTGVPMALGVIDQVRAIAPLALVTDSATPTALERDRIALGRATFGTININTAPVEVLRLLPGLTPSRAQYHAFGGGLVNEWWGFDNPDTNLPDLSLTILAENPDVAAAIIAYRDRTYGMPNTSARSRDTDPSKQYDNRPLNFESSDPGLFSQNMRGEFPLGVPFPPDNGIDRATMTGIDGIRPTPGFGSLGELLAVRINPEFEALDTDRWEVLKHLSIQQYGSDNVASGVADGPNGGKITIMSQLFGNQSNPTAGETVDDYAERISMANSVLNTLSVRSDFFAVWFVVQGYQESDVANLRPDDPLIPSVRKRYLMVIDRTNVIEPSDKPKILVFKELPM